MPLSFLSCFHVSYRFIATSKNTIGNMLLRVLPYIVLKLRRFKDACDVCAKMAISSHSPTHIYEYVCIYACMALNCFDEIRK